MSPSAIASPSADAVTLGIELVHDPVVCWAAEHCGVPLVRGLRITNGTEEPWTNAQVEVQLLPELGEPLRIPLGAMAQGETVDLGRIDYRLPAGRLRQVVEWERAEFRVQVLLGEKLLGEQRAEVEVLPCHQWPGSRLPLGLLTSFITPNHPVISQILKKTSERLKAIQGHAAIVGYQDHNPQTAKAQVVALVQTLQSLGLTYIGMPASFEQTGQKVRLPDMILRDQMANCLDMTLLSAACLEQMDLRPLVIFIKGHAFPGVWLLDDRFPEGIVEDAARLRNLMALGQILVWDSSSMLEQPSLTFAQLQTRGEQSLSNDETFQFAMDVRVMRMERFLPLPLREAPQVASESSQAAPEERPVNDELREILEAAAREGFTPKPEAVLQTNQAIGRWQRWKDRLLDLSLRNRLLNFKPVGASALALEIPDLARFEDLLADSKVFELLPRPPQDSRDARDLRLLAQREDAEVWKAQRLVDLKGCTLHSSLTPGDFLKRAKDLETLARTDLEEGGICTVFAAVGLLRWFEPGVPKERFAPLLLYPIQILFNRQLRRVCIQRLAEDPTPNVTLIEKMRRDFSVDLSFLASLEGDSSGLDMLQMLRQSREAIQRIPGWEVLEQVHLGHFTFAKFLMWKDLEDNAEILLKNPIIQHLAQDGAGTLANQPEAPTVETLESQPPGQFPCVVDADSTQLSAVASALEGRSFVIQGPPGTGKSQTIANIIACALANSRSVLFVSEKRAALEVVHSRLRQAGLEDFCLELHSNKANRKEVMESLQKALERGRQLPLQDWEAREADLKEHRDGLNTYVAALHRIQPIGFSLFEGSARAYELRHHPAIPLHLKEIEALNREGFRHILRDVEEFAHRAEALGSPQASCWQGTDPGAWTHSGQEMVREQISSTRKVLEVLNAALSSLKMDLKLDLLLAPEALEALLRIMKALTDAPMPEVALTQEGWKPIQEELEQFLDARRSLNLRAGALGERWIPALGEQDLSSALATYQQHANTVPLLRWLFLWGASAPLKKLAKNGLPDPQVVVRDLVEAAAIQKERLRLDAEGKALERLLRPAPMEQLETMQAKVKDLHQASALLQLHAQGVSAQQWVEALWKLPPERLQTHSTALSVAFKAFSAEEGNLLASLGCQQGKEPWGWTEANHLDRLKAKLPAWEQGLQGFKAWCFYREAARTLIAQGMPQIPEATIPPLQLALAVERTLLEAWSAAIRDQETPLRVFEGGHHHRKVSRFRELDRQWIQLSRAFVIRQLEGRLPLAGAGISENSEMGILMREIKKKARHMAIRKLLQAIPTLLGRLKPCLLMSPLSVAQYLPAEGKPFDLLVFDEASQITTHDAIGALARGGQVIIVGDSKQLPPTSFFSRNLDEEGTADDNDVTELESILDEAAAKQFPQQLLGWHYRSRHHALIDFSNRHYYDNRLHVFPAAARKVEDLGVAWHPVADGMYFGSGCAIRSQERTNPQEARCLVEHLVETLRRTSPEQRTFGIVTFSMTQQRLIQELLDDKRAEFPEIEPHFQGLEPVFIKNLENVQGDERDEILFSIGYAKDQRGKLRMHFGPLSVAGGERRLNVAITRARCQLRVFSTLTYDQIDLSRTSARGAEHLRAFLQYAAQQGATGSKDRPIVKFSSAFEQEIARAVEAMGYEVHTQVGCGGYRIDLAVVDPDAPGRYFLGIECDGPAYHSAIAARDRDRLRPQVLEGLGWQLHRIWSPEWSSASEHELQRLREALTTARALKPPVVAPKEQAPVPPEAVTYNAAPRASRAAEEEAPYSATPTSTPGTAYRESTPTPPSNPNPEDFYNFQSLPAIRAVVLQVLATEAPIHRDDLDGKLVRAWGWSALTKRGRTQMDLAIARMVSAKEILDRGGFIWRSDQTPAAFEGFRTPSALGPRDADRIPPEEIANAMALVLQVNLALEEEALLKETARMLGYRRVTSKTTEALKSGFIPLLKQGTCRREGGVLKLI
ncbi:DUF3320 domain-containing protein [Holophaga foetida]|uniref:DUF3320 domain-containing protein n=1 Tax=Holophaga foetida TaxID=35839 RepID=UPI000303A5EF|nr:DUF3320 domain-containing protein [Holophaga foetida]